MALKYQSSLLMVLMNPQANKQLPFFQEALLSKKRQVNAIILTANLSLNIILAM